MPRKDTHDYFEYRILGKLTGISEQMDQYSATLHSHHRALLHTPEEVLGLAVIMQNAEHSLSDLYMGGLVHIWLDNQFEEFQDQMRKTPKDQRPSGRGMAQERALKRWLEQYKNAYHFMKPGEIHAKEERTE